MPQKMKRSRTLRRIFVKTPGGRTVMHYRQRKPAKAQCAGCGRVLAGVARGRASELHKMAKSEKRPERPFGGVLCGGCMRREMIARARR